MLQSWSPLRRASRLRLSVPCRRGGRSCVTFQQALASLDLPLEQVQGRAGERPRLDQTMTQGTLQLVLSTMVALLATVGAAVMGRKHVAVVGGGWAGWGAAKALCESGVKVTLMDALPDPSGKTPYLTPSGKPFEAGQKGFWFDYPNVAQLLREVNVREQDVFTDYLNSSFYSPFGLEATAPVFSSAFQLPSPLGQVLATFQLFERLPLPDRASMAGLLYAVLDMYRDEKTFEAYDRMTAHELFIRMRLSKRLVDDFLRPTLLVGLFKAPEELSAAVVMELLYFYALAHQSSFDVRWMKKGSIAGNIFAPLCDKLTAQYDLTVLGSCRVTGLEVEKKQGKKGAVIGNKPLHVSKLQYTQKGETQSLDDLDGVVLALGAKGLSSVLGGSPEIAAASPQLSRAASMGGIDCISCRIWLDKTVATRTPANVFSRFEQLRGAGGTFFMLDQLQRDNLDELWGGAGVGEGAGEKRGSVVAVDFYNSGGLMTLSDDFIIKTITEQLLPSCVPDFRRAKVVDSYVQRYPAAVSWFSPGSYNKRPRTTVGEVDNLFCAGDWVVIKDATAELQRKQRAAQRSIYSSMGAFAEEGERREREGGSSPPAEFLQGEHGAKGLCQERAFVSGLQAANNLIAQLDKTDMSKTQTVRAETAQIDTLAGGILKAIETQEATEVFSPRLARIIPIREDEIQVQLGMKANRRVMGLLGKLGLDNPWLR